MCYNWYLATFRPSLHTHLKLALKKKAGKTRAAFEKLKAVLEAFDPEDLKYLKDLSFINFENHFTKTLEILKNSEFDLETLEIFTSQLGNMVPWKNFIEAKCTNLRNFTSNVFTFSHKALNNILPISTLTKIVIHDSGPGKGFLLPKLSKMSY